MTGGNQAVAALLRPRSVAVVGASERSWYGSSTLRNLIQHGFPGNVYPVNPRYETQFGRDCYPSLADLPTVPDVAVVGVRAELAVDVVTECARVGVPSAVIFTDGFREAGAAGANRQRRLASVAEAAGMAICGPNSMGLVSARHRAPLWLGRLGAIDPDGRIGAVVQSGSVGIALLNAERGLRFGYLVSTGNEAVTPAADYLAALVADDGIDILVSHVETVNASERYLAALEAAHRAGKPVVVLKTGRSTLARRVIAGHTGNVAGRDEVARNLLADRGAILVSSLEELIETLVLLNTVRRPAGRRAGVVTISGGYSGLVADLAHAVGLDLPEELTGPAERIRNLTDAWGNGDMAATVGPVLATAATATNTDLLAVVHDLEPDPTSGTPEIGRTLAGAVADVAGTTDKPVVWLTPTTRPADPVSGARLAAAGVPRLSGLTSGLAACAGVGRWAAVRELPPRPPVTGLPVRDAEPTGEVWSEEAGKRWLAAAGIAVPERRLTRTEDDAAAAGAELGFPVVLKRLAAGVAHKARRGYVRLDVAGEADLRRHYRELTADGPGEVLVERQVPRGIEVMVSAFVDASFGRVVLVGFGGVANELYPPPAIRLAPADHATARTLADQSGVAGLIRKLTGDRAEAVIDHLAIVVERISRAFVADGTALRLVEVNPVILPFDGTPPVAVDALVQPA